MHGDTVWRLRAVPLTPVHVGDGRVLDPMDYVLREREAVPEWMYDELDDDDPRLLGSDKPPRLVRFDWRRALAAMAASRRTAVLTMLRNGDIRGAATALKKAARPAGDAAEIILSDPSHVYLRGGFDDPDRRCEVRGFLRSGATPIIAGSSFKGALRTAWLSKLVEDGPAAATLRAGDAQGFEARLLGHDRGAFERDPLRHVLTSDAPVPASATRVEPVARVQRKDAELATDGRQLHVETLAPDRLDAGIEVRVAFADPARHAAAAGIDRRKTPERPVDPEALWRALKAFGDANRRYEADRFWRLCPVTVRLLNQAMSRYRPDDPDQALARIGAFTHFESKSLAGVRANPHHTTKQLRSEGGTRAAVARNNDNNQPGWLPLGWLLLTRVRG